MLLKLNLSEKSIFSSKTLHLPKISAQIVSMTREPKLAVFCRPPIYDLKLNFDEEEEEERKEMIRPWPDLEFVFGDDPEYQALLAELGTYMTMELELVKNYATVSYSLSGPS